MWAEAEILKNIVVDTARIEHLGNSILLKERDPKAVLCNIYIENVSKDGITLKADCHAESFFKRNYGNRRCDFIILSSMENNRVALFIDMKSTSLSEVDVVEGFPHDLGKGYPSYVHQLRSSSCFFDFLHIVMKEFCSCTELSKYTKKEHRFFVVLHTKDMSAINRPVLRTRPRNNNTPEAALILHVENNDHIDFNRLVLL